MLKGHTGSIRSLHYDPLRARVITGSDDKNIGMYDISCVNLAQQGGATMEVQPHYMLTGPKQPVTDVVVLLEEDNRLHSMMAIVKDRSVYHWKFLSDSAVQKLGVSHKKTAAVDG